MILTSLLFADSTKAPRKDSNDQSGRLAHGPELKKGRRGFRAGLSFGGIISPSMGMVLTNLLLADSTKAPRKDPNDQSGRLAHGPEKRSARFSGRSVFRWHYFSFNGHGAHKLAFCRFSTNRCNPIRRSRLQRSACRIDSNCCKHVCRS